MEGGGGRSQGDGFGLTRATCLVRDAIATSPRSPTASISDLIASTERPHVSETALIMIESPMPSSTPAYLDMGAGRCMHSAHLESLESPIPSSAAAYAGASLFVERAIRGSSSSGDVAIT